MNSPFVVGEGLIPKNGVLGGYYQISRYLPLFYTYEYEVSSPIDKVNLTG